MLGLLLIPMMAFQTPPAPAPDLFRTSCETVHAQLAEFTRGPSVVAEGNDDDRITTTPLTHTKKIYAYLNTPVSVVHVERYSYDTEGYTDTIEFTLESPFIATKGYVKILHKVDCLPSSDNNRCDLPDIRTSGNPIMMWAFRQGAQSLVKCTQVRART